MDDEEVWQDIGFYSPSSSCSARMFFFPWRCWKADMVGSEL